MAKYDAILFDFDGVLADSEPLHWQCWREMLAPLGIGLTWDVYQAQCIGVADREMLETLGAMKDPPVSLDVLWPLYPKKKELFRQRAALAPPVRPETIEAVKQLSIKKLAVVTSSGRAEVEPILQRVEILPLLGAAIYGDDPEVPRLKPAPDPYVEAARRLGAQSPLVFEDSAAGLASAQAAGFEFVRVIQPGELAALLKPYLA